MTGKIITRAQWGAKAPTRGISRASVQRQGFVVHHSVTPEWTGFTAPRGVQNIHLGMGWADVGYNFLIDRNGNVYEGRRLDVVGGHTMGHNTRLHAVCLVGNHTSRAPSDKALEAVNWLYLHGQRQGWWPARLTGHRDHVATACPGNRAYALLPVMRNQPTTPPPDTRTWFDMATEQDLERVIQRVLRQEVGYRVWSYRGNEDHDVFFMLRRAPERIWGHSITGWFGSIRTGTLLSRLQGGGIDDVLRAIQDLAKQIFGRSAAVRASNAPKDEELLLNQALGGFEDEDDALAHGPEPTGDKE